MNIYMNPGISLSVFVIAASVRQHFQIHPKFTPLLRRVPEIIKITPLGYQYQSSEILVPPVPDIRYPSYSEGRPKCPPRVWSSSEIDSSKFSLHILSDTPGVLQRLKYILLMLQSQSQRQQNVIQSGSYMQSSQTLWATSLVLLSTSRCFQTPLELSKMVSDSARAFSGASESSCSYGGAFRMLLDLTDRIVKCWSS